MGESLYSMVYLLIWAGGLSEIFLVLEGKTPAENDKLLDDIYNMQ